jgi:hypothetical protein
MLVVTLKVIFNPTGNQIGLKGISRFIFLFVSPTLEIWIGLKDFETVMPLPISCWSIVCFVDKTFPTLIACFGGINSFDRSDYLFNQFLTVPRKAPSPLFFGLRNYHLYASQKYEEK